MSNNSSVKVGWIGLGAMGGGMSSSLCSQGFQVKAFDVWQPSLDAAVKAGAIAAASPQEAAIDVQTLALMVVNAAQVEDALFGAGKVAEVLQPGASIICFSTVPPTFLVALREKLDALGKDIGLCDSPVSGGSTRAADGTLSIMVSGTESSISTARPVLDALTRPIGGLTVVGDSVGTASDFKLINQVFCAIQIAVPSEAMAFAKSLGLNPRMTANVIKTASGHSFMFGHRTPWMLRDDGVPKSAMTIIAKDIGIVMDDARLNLFPAPLCAMVEQVYVAALGAGMHKQDDGLLVRLWQAFGGQSVQETGTEEEEIEKAKELEVVAKGKPSKVLCVGLGAMGAPMALSIQKGGLDVSGFEVADKAKEEYKAAGGKLADDLSTAAKSAEVVVIATVTEAEADAVIFGDKSQSGISSVLPEGSTVIITSTVSPSFAVSVQDRLTKAGRKVQLMDAPMSGGPSRAIKGDLAFFASGETDALQKAASVLETMSTAAGNKVNLHYIPGGVGFGSKMKVVNQLLAGVHLCAAAEAMSFAQHKKMDLDKVFGVVSIGAGSSYMMVDRIPRMLQADAPVFSATDTLVKDMAIVLAEAKRTSTPVWLAATAHQQFIKAAAAGWGREDDSCVGRLWESMGVSIRK